MSTDNRDLLAVLKTELSFLEQGGYAGSEGHPWRPSFVFEDSPSCFNYNDRDRSHRCTECSLIQLVPDAFRKEKSPCRRIPLNENGETIMDFYQNHTQRELEWALMVWLRKTITHMEHERGKLGKSKRACDCNNCASCPNPES